MSTDSERGSMTEMTYREFRLRCPYGIWRCADRREVLFNRQYWPILERRPDEPVKPANPNEWVHWVAQDWFFEDANSPWHPRRYKVAADSLARCNCVLAEWGYPPLPKPAPTKVFRLDLTDQPRVNPYADAPAAPDRAFRIFPRIVPR
jgi:hypothetical protein